uniref:LAGLIDADG endonuclease n=1 Tax=Clavaria fumosa TaxID=264083 RepID=A0A7T3U4W4_9AGAR|nr:LAGLIDADG endonuclease [Clavaria fumosa]QPZ51115.1 LAGLIDADG endonuclease [Clavaria fumosa]
MKQTFILFNLNNSNRNNFINVRSLPKELNSVLIGIMLGAKPFSSSKNIKIIHANKNNRLTNFQRKQFTLSKELKEILIGLFLGDLCAQRRSTNTNLHFEQGFKHKDYILHLFDLFKNYCRSKPKISERPLDKRTNKIYTRVQFATLSLPCFNELYLLFYSSGKKIIPLNIKELLTPIGLAYWAMDDGHKDRNNFIFNTNSYTLKEVELLKLVLKENFSLDCTIQQHKINQYRLNIRTKSVPHFKELVNPYFYDSMKHKLI